MSEAARTFTVSGENITLVGGPTLVFINPDTDVGLEIVRCWAAQDTTESNEQQRIRLFTQVSAFPTLVSATPRPHLHGETSLIVGGTAGAVGTCGINASAEGAGAKTIIVPDAFNNLIGWLYVPTPAEIHKVRAAADSGFGMQLATTPAILTGWSFGITFKEV